MYFLDKKVAGKSKAEQMTERQQELERRLQDVTGQLGSSKKNAKKGKLVDWLTRAISLRQLLLSLRQMIQAKQMHKLPTANHHPVVQVIHHLLAHPTAVLAIAPIAKQVRRLKHVSTLSQEIIQTLKSQIVWN